MPERAIKCPPRLRFIVWTKPISEERMAEVLGLLRGEQGGYRAFVGSAKAALREGGLGHEYDPAAFDYKRGFTNLHQKETVCLLPPERRDPTSECALNPWLPPLSVAGDICPFIQGGGPLPTPPPVCE